MTMPIPNTCLVSSILAVVVAKAQGYKLDMSKATVRTRISLRMFTKRLARPMSKTRLLPCWLGQSAC